MIAWSPNLHVATGENMLVADSKPLTKPHSSSEQPDKRIQQGGSEP